jgi:hypothetical protein
VMGFFQERISRIICQDWLQTAILLISASWAARIIGVSHRHPSYLFFFFILCLGLAANIHGTVGRLCWQGASACRKYERWSSNGCPGSIRKDTHGIKLQNVQKDIL